MIDEILVILKTLETMNLYRNKLKWLVSVVIGRIAELNGDS
jgi:hypothetical protein